MTEKQRDYIIYLEAKCIERHLTIRASDKEMLGSEWWKDYQNITPKYTMEVIDKLKVALGMPIQEYHPKSRRKKR